MRDNMKNALNPKFLIFSSLWITAVVMGLAVLFKFETRPGASANASLQWPIETSLKQNSEKFSLVIFAHPRCSCSRATIGELERLMPTLKDKALVSIFFVQPEKQDLNWVKTALFERAQQIPGVQVFIDKNLKEARFFDAKTSGQTFFYNQQGQLLFSGGITPSRGHMGDSQGRELILKWVSDQTGPTLGRTPVFGCALEESSLTATREDESS